jgi:putative iron-dependent peroxidase
MLDPQAIAMPQSGIFALGEAAHIYLELTAGDGVAPEELVRAVVVIDESRTTARDVNVVIGFRPEIWQVVASHDAPAGLKGFNDPLSGSEGFSMPATQADLFVWIAGGSHDMVFDFAREALAKLAPVALVAREIDGWSYKHNRDLTGFEDGTENPALMIAPSIATIPAGRPGAGGSVLLFQLWEHHAKEWDSLPVPEQEKVIGRTKSGSVEFSDAVQLETSHVSRTTVEMDGSEHKIFRRNTAYGNATVHGTVFVGFSQDRDRLELMLRRMAGTGDGIRDALTRYSTPLTGAYYFCPSLRSLQAFAGEAIAGAD